MKTIIAGSRSATKYTDLLKAIKESGFTISMVVCGEAKGADSLGRRWAERNNIPIESYPADWEKYGKRAGMIRNQQMADSGAEALILLWDGKSSGSKNMLSLARKNDLKVFIYYI